MKRCFSLLVLLFLICTACASAPSVGEVGTVEQFFAMDTVMTLTVCGGQEEAAIQAAREEIQRLEGLLSRTRDGSQISALNAHAGDGAPIPMDPSVLDLLAFSRDLSQELEGCFDLTLAPVLDAWGFTGDQQQVPSQTELDRLLTLVDSRALLLEDSSARLETAGMAVDLGASAKGYAAGRASAAVQGAGGTSALLDLGQSSITAIGQKPNGDPWRVAVRDPQDEGGYLGVLSLRDQSLSTSGGYERYFEENGVRYHHIIDPKTGWPAESGLLSVTVVSGDPTLADALSTALFVAGKEAALDYWRSRTGFELILCGSDGVVTITEGLEETFSFREDQGYRCETARR